MTRRAFAALLAAGLATVPAADAHAFVRTTTTSGTPIEWRGGCITFRATDGVNPDFAPERLQAVLQRSLDSWNKASSACSPLRIDFDTSKRTKADVAFDNENSIVWRLRGYCDNAKNKDDQSCLSPNAAGTTTVFFRDRPGDPSDGEIVDTDIQLNAANFRFDDTGAKDKIDLASVLTHEFGHALGLDHTCYTTRGGAVPKDANGAPAPFCFPVGKLPQPVVRATMFNFTEPGDSSKSNLSTDEADAVCAVYGSYPAKCTEGGTAAQGGCTVSTRPGEVARWALPCAAAIAGLLAWRRRRKAVAR